MNSTMKGLIQLIKDEQALRCSALKEEVLKEEMQTVTGNNYTQETNAINGPAMPPAEDVGLEDPNLLLDPALNFAFITLEQKKTMLIEYFNKLINKVVIIRDHIDTLSFDSVMSSNMVIGASQLQFNLEELKTKISKYIEDQYESDKYERSLYVYLSFMEELRLIVKLLQRQTKKL